MKNYVQPGKNISIVESALVHPSHSDGLVDSGDPVCAGRLVGVANTDAAASTDKVAITTEGVFDLSVVGNGNGVSIGETVFIDQSSGVLSNDETDTPFGLALEAISAGQTDTINVKLFGATPGATGAFS